MSRTHVLMLPAFTQSNPYLNLLADHLKQFSVDVTFPEYGLNIPESWALASEDGARPVDLMHLHWTARYQNPDSRAGFLTSCADVVRQLRRVRHRGTPIVWTVHNAVAHDSPHPDLDLRMRRLIAQTVDALIVHSVAAARQIGEAYRVDADRISVIPHGHYRPVYGAPIEKAEARARLGLPAEGRIFLSLGMRRPYKQTEALASLWKESPALRDHHTLLLAGKQSSGNPEPRLAEISEGCGSIVLRLEKIPDDWVHIYLSAADVFVLPYGRMLTSGALLLAMSFGKPAVAPAFEQIVETVGGTHELLYDPEDPNGLAGSLHRAATIDLDPLARSAAVQCDKLDWDRIAGLTYQVFQNATRRARGGRLRAMPVPVLAQARE